MKIQEHSENQTFTDIRSARNSMFVKFTLAKTGYLGRRCSLLSVTLCTDQVNEPAEMRKDNSNNAGEQPGSVDDNQRRCRSQDGTGSGTGDKSTTGTGSRSELIAPQILTSLILPLPSFDSSKTTS